MGIYGLNVIQLRQLDDLGITDFGFGSAGIVVEPVDPMVPSNAILAENNVALTTETGEYLLLES